MTRSTSASRWTSRRARVRASLICSPVAASRLIRARFRTRSYDYAVTAVRMPAWMAWWQGGADDEGLLAHSSHEFRLRGLWVSSGFHRVI